MIQRRSLLLWVVLLAAAGVSFTLTWTARAQQETSSVTSETSQATVLRWLDVSGPQSEAMSRDDPNFGDELASLRKQLADKRSALASALDDPALTDDALRAHSEAVIDANAALERRVTEHLIAIRPHLTAAQQRKLFGVCADGVRQGRGGQWRHGRSGAK